MFTSDKVFIRTTATTGQLKGLGKTVERWRDEHRTSTGCMHDVDCDGLDDLLAGELPKPELLRFTDSFRRSIEKEELEGFETVDLPEHLAWFRQQIPDTKRRNIRIFIEHSLECSYQPFKCGYKEAIRDLVVAVGDGLIEDIEAGSIPHPPLSKP